MTENKEMILEQEEDTQKGKYLTFNLGKEVFGIEIRHVTEIIGIQPISEVPEVPDFVKGIINLRGKIIPLIDVRLKFKPFILKLRHMVSQGKHLNPDHTLADAMMRVDGLTGMLSRYGLMEAFEREAKRSQRYQNPFTIAVIHVLPVKNMVELHHDEYRDVCLEDMAQIMGQVFRQTDVLGRWSEMGFAVLFTETCEDDTQQALVKLVDFVNQHQKSVYEVAAGCSGFFQNSLEETLRMAESNALLQKSLLDGREKITIVMAGQAV